MPRPTAPHSILNNSAFLLYMREVEKALDRKLTKWEALRIRNHYGSDLQPSTSANLLRNSYKRKPKLQ